MTESNINTFSGIGNSNVKTGSENPVNEDQKPKEEKSELSMTVLPKASLNINANVYIPKSKIQQTNTGQTTLSSSSIPLNTFNTSSTSYYNNTGVTQNLNPNSNSFVPNIKASYNYTNPQSNQFGSYMMNKTINSYNQYSNSNYTTPINQSNQREGSYNFNQSTTTSSIPTTSSTTTPLKSSINGNIFIKLPLIFLNLKLHKFQSQKEIIPL